MSKRPITILALGAAGAAGYYLYTAGGDPKLAQKNAEYDASRASSKIKSELPGKGKEVEKSAESYAAAAGSKVDSAVSDSKAKLSSAESKLEQIRKDASGQIMSKIDAADRKIEDASAKAAKKASSWFGGK